MSKRRMQFLAAPLALLLPYFLLLFLIQDFQSDARLQQHDFRATKKICEISPLLGELLIVVSFHWDVTKLIYFTTVLDTIRTYETRVHIVIVTDHEKALRRALQKMEPFHGSNPTLTFSQVPPTNDTNKFAMCWAHRQVIEKQFEQYPNFTSIIYLEDDQLFSWPTLVSWALDTEVLAPLNFTRCIYRTEVDVETGESNMGDWRTPVKLTHENTINVTHTLDFARVQNRLQNAPHCHCGKHRDGAPWPCRVHDNYVSPTDPFQGIWMASRAQLVSFMAHPFWEKDAVYDAKLKFDMGYPERTTFMNLMINVPTGYRSNCMVPLVPNDEIGGLRNFSLPLVAGIEHMRNRYSSMPNTRLGKLHVEEAI